MKAVQCSEDSHYDGFCDACRLEKACAEIYHIDHATDGICSATDKMNFHSMFKHLYVDRAYGLPEANKRFFCDEADTMDEKKYKPLLLYYQYGPSCNDGETFEMYPGGQSGFCYCGTDCDKSYSNPPMNTLLTALVVVIGVNILFNGILLLYRYRDYRQPAKNTISTTGTVRAKRVNLVHP